MAREKFTLAPDAAARDVNCEHYSLNGGAPRCAVLNHPWCLAPRYAPSACKFRDPKAAKPEKKKPLKKETPAEATKDEAN